MKRLGAGVGLLMAGAVLLIPAGALGGPPPRAALQDFSCRDGLNPVNRTVGVTTVMRPVAGTAHLAVKIRLLVSRPHSSAVRSVRGGDLGTWIKPRNPTLGQLPGDVWNLQKTVVQLAAPASFRFRVQFRWEDDHDQTIAMAVRYTRRCSERELRPDLVVRSIAVNPEPGQPTENLYSAVIANNGNSGAGPLEVLFAPGDGSATATQTISRLAAHGARVENFVGPACTPSTAPTITADSAHQVDDLNRSNNALTATCPDSNGG